MSPQTVRRRVSYAQTIEYEVVNCPDVFDPGEPALLSAGRVENARRFVVVDANVAGYYLPRIRNYFLQNGVEARIVTFPAGEEHKTMESYLAIAGELDAFPIHRRDEPVIAIGGGVLTDVVGFAAGSYRRGVPHIKVPTTLMGYVDASIGIKTGVNFNGHKNRLGSFTPPQMVLLDKTFLKTLPKRHLLNGVCEIVKLAVIKDAELFGLLEQNGRCSVESQFQDEAGEGILDRAIHGMLEELAPNLYEEDLRRRMDFGHTFSYGLETRCEAHLLHGEAVLLDILLSTLIAHRRALLSETEAGRVFQLAADLGLNLDISPLDPALLWGSLVERTYHRNGLQRVPLPNGLGGCVFVNDVKAEEIESAVSLMEEWITIKNDIL